MVEAWYMINEVEDQQAENRRSPNEAVPLSYLQQLGVLHWHIPPAPEVLATYPKVKVPWTPEAGTPQDAALAELREQKGMGYADIICVAPDTLPEYEKKVKAFFEEHMHDDDEIRYILDGCGYFDVRSVDDRWIRIKCTGGDLISLPKGMYHRFTTDPSNFVHAMRLFVGAPIWTPINRSEEANDHSARLEYLEEFISSAKRQKTSHTPSFNAWYMAAEVADCKAENRQTPNKPCPPEVLQKLGVVYYHLPIPADVAYPTKQVPWEPEADKPQDAKLAALRKELGMGYADIITVSPDTLPNYEKMIAAFFEEHLHDDDEIRYIIGGTGYFDVRSADEEWIRIRCEAGQCITLPKGIYHRFTTDPNDYVHAMRLFVGEPIWTPFNRGEETDKRDARKVYEEHFLAPVPCPP
eukprot:TRINITY_DN597_c0_g3_i1.p1 TRINITY_DN597_c0_g3~~TRINITY_DN597_c0_g3_i1.p1  ORF type:complete len:410 (+),score=197.39 TRINITY_DN597_c0_g3_i1:73-1302(+)